MRESLSEINRIDGTLEGLLPLMHIGEFDPAPVDVGEALEHSLFLINRQARRKSISI